jgi:hypothetical protein
MIDVATDTLIPMDEVAKRFGVAYRTAMTWPQRLGLEARKVGGRVYTTPAALNAIAKPCGVNDRREGGSGEQAVGIRRRREAPEELSPEVIAAAARHGVLLG